MIKLRIGMLRCVDSISVMQYIFVKITMSYNECTYKHEARVPLRSSEYHRLYTDTSEGVILHAAHQQLQTLSWKKLTIA